MKTHRLEAIQCCCGGTTTVKVEPGQTTALATCACGKQLFWSATVDCLGCNGTGKKDGKLCENCKGIGKLPASIGVGVGSKVNKVKEKFGD